MNINSNNRSFVSWLFGPLCVFLFPKWNAIAKRNFSVTLHTFQVPKTKRLEWLSKQSRVHPFWKFWTARFGRVLVGKRIANEENSVRCLSDLLMSALGESWSRYSNTIPSTLHLCASDFSPTGSELQVACKQYSGSCASIFKSSSKRREYALLITVN